jgi:hypothetical protein
MNYSINSFAIYFSKTEISHYNQQTKKSNTVKFYKVISMLNFSRIPSALNIISTMFWLIKKNIFFKCSIYSFVKIFSSVDISKSLPSYESIWNIFMKHSNYQKFIFGESLKTISLVFSCRKCVSRDKVMKRPLFDGCFPKKDCLV